MLTVQQFLVFTLIFSLILPQLSQAGPSPAVVGWGNMLVPGLGATLRGESGRGLGEMTSELGLYYGGTFGAREGSFSIDGSVLVPDTGRVYRPLIGQMLQEAGLKLHMYDTFYNYQQAAIAEASSARETENPQPLYKGTIHDQLSAPFEWKNLSDPWVYPLILISAAYLTYGYATTPVPQQRYRANKTEDRMYALSQVAVIPFGSVLGEESFFRGFIQREIRGYTGSEATALIFQSTLFALIHPKALQPSAFASGIFFGMTVNHFDGNIEKPIAAHFWVNVFDGVITYLQFRRTQGINTPLSPPIATQIQIPF